MSSTRADRLSEVLGELVEHSGQITAAAVISYDGLVMASHLPEELEEDRVGAMSAALLSLGEQAVAGLRCGRLETLFTEGTDGYVFLMSVEGEAVLVAVADAAAKIGLVLFELRQALPGTAEVLRERDGAATPPAVVDSAASRFQRYPAAPAPVAAPPAPAPEPIAEPAHTAAGLPRRERPAPAPMPSEVAGDPAREISGALQPDFGFRRPYGEQAGQR